MTHATSSSSCSTERTLRLGLIGGNITETRSPVLHMACGLAIGRNATYDLIIPKERGLSFAQTLAQCAELGFDGVNVTFPYKEEALRLVAPGTPVVAAMGSTNAVKFTAQGPRAFNTDHSGFVAAYRNRFGAQAPGRVLVLGTGGVGRAVAFGLADLGASEIVLLDTDLSKAVSLGGAIMTYCGAKVIAGDPSMLRDLSGFDGVVNCTPLGMVGKPPASPLPEDAAGHIGWAFDAVYTPLHTPFRAQVERMGARFLSGYELYFHQGVDAFEIFSERKVEDADWVRALITHSPDTPPRRAVG
ncbi:shikimate dehydrogenase family protein [Thioclava pacifica]|uniref:Shikimate dehydrogenase substrate binding N-terminal domain-containing protein n=1 Tax=Thioclava pacifica DSM 10166 TaxID=1353537 RepID=A0A074JCQ1_9RHOB|nr:shikimate dehydrogenase [Thioclava pacifica]KEO55426.1 hypothetical protein TP2_15405 [Thioclava pacifica DSM 10166]